MVHIPVSMDHMIVMGNSRAAMDMVKSELQELFDITDQGELTWLLRFKVWWDRVVRTIRMNQRAYINVLA